jgi:hypothetical protein
MPEQIKKYLPYIIIGVIIILILIAVIFMMRNTSTDEEVLPALSGDSIDATQDFYASWLAAAKEQTLETYALTLTSDNRISDSVHLYITSALAEPERALDPVLCQAIVPERFGVKPSYEVDGKAQLLVLARGLEEPSPNLAVVDLEIIKNQWQITNISCSSGESAPQGEFSFEREGFLLKSVPAPLNSDYWHIVYEDGGQMGYTAPLFLSAESMCVGSDGVEVVCNESQFVEASKVRVQGEMTESGVEVKRITLN